MRMKGQLQRTRSYLQEARDTIPRKNPAHWKELHPVKKSVVDGHIHTRR